MTPCFECGKLAEHDHHVVPRSCGGTKTVPLCAECHGNIHDISLNQWQLAKRGRRLKAAQGGFIGGRAPYGWRMREDDTLEPCEREQAIIRAARILQAEGLALRKIGERLEAEGLLPRAGKWHAETVKQVLAGRLA